MIIDGKGFIFTNDAWDYLEQKRLSQIKPQRKRGRPFGKSGSIRINASKRRNMPYDLKQLVYDRSKKLCELCGLRGDAIHHIRSVYRYPEQQFNLDNLIHLCVECHADQHHNMKPVLFLDNKFRTI